MMTGKSTINKRIFFHREIHSSLTKGKHSVPIFRQYTDLLKKGQDPIEQSLVPLYEWLIALLDQSSRKHRSPFGPQSNCPLDNLKNILGERIVRVIEEGLHSKDAAWEGDLHHLEMQAELFNCTLWEHALAVLIKRYKAACYLREPPIVIQWRPDLRRLIFEKHREFDGTVAVKKVADNHEAEHIIQIIDLRFSIELIDAKPKSVPEVESVEDDNVEDVECGKNCSLKIECERYPLEYMIGNAYPTLELGERYPFLVRVVEESENPDPPQIRGSVNNEVVLSTLLDNKDVSIRVTVCLLDRTGPFTSHLRVRLKRI